MITPNTVIKFLQVPFSSSQNNVLKFASKNDQITYMDSKVQFNISDVSYQREGNGEYIRVGKSMDSLYNCNYVMFQNSNYGTKWFYGFIEKLEWASPNVTRVFLKIDVYQTFQFDFTLEKSFIERQHFATDYYNTLVDTPSSGELKSIFEYAETILGDYFILFNTDPTIEDPTTVSAYFPKIGAYSMPVYMCWCSSANQVSEIVQAVSNKGRADRIQACYYSPFTGGSAITTIGQHPKGDLNISYDLNLVSEITPNNLYKDITVNIDYIPTFKKELSYPYAKLEIVDKITGKFIELDLSKFQDPLNPQFKIQGNVSELPEYKVIPKNYNGIEYSIENALVVQPKTEMPVFSNSYAKYLKDNKTANLISGAMGVTGAIGSIATGNIAGAVGSFASIAQTLNADHVAKTQPNQVSGINGDGCEYVTLYPKIFFRLKIMDSNHMDIARNFWNMFGYPVRKLANVNPFTKKYNFLKTVDCNIIADSIPSEYQRELEDIFDKGVTIWTSDYLNYDLI